MKYKLSYEPFSIQNQNQYLNQEIRVYLSQYIALQDHSNVPVRLKILSRFLVSFNFENLLSADAMVTWIFNKSWQAIETLG